MMIFGVCFVLYLLSIIGGSRALIGVCIFICSGSAQLIYFEIRLISKEISRAEPEYMNMHPLN